MEEERQVISCTAGKAITIRTNEGRIHVNRLDWMSEGMSFSVSEARQIASILSEHADKLSDNILNTLRGK